MISAKHINLLFNSAQVLKDIHFDLQSGQVATIIGPSGSGKTTLLRVLCLLERPDSGTLLIDDLKYHFPLEELEVGQEPWPRVTFVFQDLYLWPHLTLRQNILLPFKVNGKEAIKKVEEEFQELVSTLSLQECLDRRPHEVSGGEKQRAAIVRAILLHPRYLLLDEITSALDIEQVAVILGLLSDLRERGQGMVIVSHHLEFAKRVSNQVYFLDEGKIVESGPPEILDQPKTDRLERFLEFIKKAR
ncbi:MAG: amino acid ABC transporter ATP-binding protein [Thermodesulfobacteriota bacterium]